MTYGTYEEQMQQLTFGFRLRRELADDFRQLKQELAFSGQMLKEALEREPLIPRIRRICAKPVKMLKAMADTLVKIWGLRKLIY